MAKSKSASTAGQSPASGKSTRSASKPGKLEPGEWLIALETLLTNRPDEIRAVAMNSTRYPGNVVIYLHPCEVKARDGQGIELTFLATAAQTEAQA